MTNAVSKQAMHSDLHLIEVWTAAWLLYFHFEQSLSRAPLAFTLFALGAGAIAFLMLLSAGFFWTFRVTPRTQDALLFACVAPSSALITNYASSLIIGAPLVPYAKVLVLSVALGGMSFCAFFLLWALSIKLGMKRRIVFDVTPSERSLLLRDLASNDIEPYIEALSMDDLRAALQSGSESEIDLIIISATAVRHFDGEGLLMRAHLAGIPIVDRRSMSWMVTGRVRLADTDLWSYLLAATRQTAALRLFAQAKRILEPLFALFLAILFSPIMLFIAAGLKLTSRGPVFYKQTRTGYLGRQFKLVKFRSMYVDAEANGPQWASRDDSRVTPFGKFLRKTRLDELPQLWNVIRGEMSFVGPRPERPEIYEKLQSDVPLFSVRTIVRPGITGWAQVLAGYAASIAESQVKLEYDLYYIQHMSPRLDLLVLLKTIKVAILGDSNAAEAAAEVQRLAGQRITAEEAAT